MISPRVWLYAVPERYWLGGATADERGGDAFSQRLGQFAAEALGAERRIRTAVNLEHERERYSLLCERIEAEVSGSDLVEPVKDPRDVARAVNAGRLPALLIGQEYLTFLRSVIPSDPPARLGATFFLPAEMTSHLDAFVSLCRERGAEHYPALQARSEFFRRAAEAGCGVIEVQYPLAVVDGDPDALAQTLVAPETTQSERPVEHSEGVIATALSEAELQEAAPLQSRRKQHQIHALIRAVSDAVQNGAPANFSNRSNDVIAEVLRRFVYVPADHTLTPVPLRVVYADGSEGGRFPIRCLRSITASVAPDTEESPLRVALMSMRHLDLDRDVDFTWFRNREVSRTRTLAETDGYCYRTTLELLDQALADGVHVLHLYHTGFEPAVIGFYRGLVARLSSNAPVAVLPLYYRGPGRFERGNWWLSHGASPSGASHA